MKNRTTIQNGFCVILTLGLIYSLRDFGIIKAIIYGLLFVGICIVVVNIIAFLQNIRKCNVYEEIYRAVKLAESYRYKSHFISEWKQREEEIKEWNDYIDGVGGLLIASADDFLQNNKIPKKREMRLREIIIETKRIMTTK